MIPYFTIPKVDLGPIPIDPFGIFAAAGVLFATWLAAKRTEAQGQDPDILRDWAPWALVGGLVGAHLMHLFAYHPEELREGGIIGLLKVWDGLSSTGGILGALVTGGLYLRWRGERLLDYVNAIALAMAPGWAIARVGCFIVHDHPGRRTTFPLAVAFPPSVYPGGPRHDLGLDDAIALALITGVLWFLASRRAWAKGALLAVLAVLYSTQRFLTDFLRATDLSYRDARYAGLTPGQYVCLGLFAWGVWHLWRSRAWPGQPLRAAAAHAKPPGK